MFGGSYMYPFILIHELGHAICISKISKSYNSDIRPVIVIGDYEKCLCKKPNHKLLGFDIYYYDKFFVNKGITLSPDFIKFSDEEIIKCAKAGCKMEMLFSFIYVLISLISLVIFILTHNLLFALFLLIFAFSGIIQGVLAVITIIKSKDKDTWKAPKSFDAKHIEKQYYHLRSSSSHISM